MEGKRTYSKDFKNIPFRNFQVQSYYKNYYKTEKPSKCTMEPLKTITANGAYSVS